MTEETLKKLDHTLIKDRINQIIKLYDKLEKKQIKFCETFDIHCLNGCGECCKNFIPDITEVEALFLAYGLIKDGMSDEVLKTLHSPFNQYKCPLYNNDSIYHCTVYKYRPLVCRLFGASASTDKFNKCVYRKCKFNNISHDISNCEFMAHKSAILLMSDYGEAINEIEPDYMEKELLPIALEKAILKIEYILELEDKN